MIKEEYIILSVASENYDDPRTVSKACVGELIVKELQTVDMLAPNVSALYHSRGWAVEQRWN